MIHAVVDEEVFEDILDKLVAIRLSKVVFGNIQIRKALEVVVGEGGESDSYDEVEKGVVARLN